MNKYYGLVWSSIILALVFGYQNCGQVGFDTSSSELARQLGDLEASSAVEIENGAEFTRQSNVQLQLNATRATQMKISNKDDCSDGTWEAFSRTRNWELDQKNAKVAVYAQYRDLRNNVTKCVSDDITHDDQPPSLTFSNAQNAYVKTQALNVRWVARDNLSGPASFSCRNTAGAVAACADQSFSASAQAEGGNSIAVQVTDSAGNKSEFIPYSWTFDQTPPIVKINSNINGTTTGDSVSLSFSATDNVGVDQIRCNLDNQGFQPCTSPQALTLAQGPHTFQVTASDKAGNSPDQPQSVSFLVDTSVPDVQITKKPNAPSNVADPIFTFVGNDNGQAITTGFKCTLDGKAAACTGTEQKYVKLADGDHTFVVSYTDTANQTGQDSYSWKIDTVKPTISLKSPFMTYDKATAGSFTWTIVEANGIASYACALDGQAVSPCSSAGANVSNLKAGAHTFTVTVMDAAGNSGTASAQWTSDFTPPTVTIVDGPGAYVKETEATFTFNASEPNVSYKCKLDSAPTYSACASPFVIADLAPNSSHDLYVLGVDRAGNESVPATRHWEIDRKGPLIITQDPPTVVHKGDMASFAYQVRDEGVGVASVKCGLKDYTQACDLAAGRIVVDTSKTGSYQYLIHAEDKFGNASDKTFNITVTAALIVCDVFSTDDSKCNGGLVGSIYYLDQAHQTSFKQLGAKTVEYFFGADQYNRPNAVKVAAVLNLKQLNVPTRNFSEGFPASSGTMAANVKNEKGEDLTEYFAFDLRANLQLDQSADAEGWYQFATISDDGSTLAYLDTDNGATQYKTLVSNDGDHSTRMGCSTEAIYINDQSSFPVRIKYYQGPRTEIALVMIWRKVTGPNAAKDALCGTTTADFTKFPYAKSGWQVLNATNFLAPAN